MQHSTVTGLVLALLEITREWDIHRKEHKIMTGPEARLTRALPKVASREEKEVK
jgi:hypothetical protein